MKDQAIEIAMKESGRKPARNRLREYLQHVILRQMFEQNLLNSLIFHGGTGLRIIHDLARFSEDLDFHLEKTDYDFDFPKEIDSMKKGLALSGYRVQSKSNLSRNVKHVFIKFEELLLESGISSQVNEILSIKIEIDTNPPFGFGVEKNLVNQYFPFVVKHYDKPTFIAGMLHSILQRPYVKGRDFYDLLFYLSRWKDVMPNLDYLNNALEQTGYSRPKVEISNWRQLIIERIRSIDWEKVQADVAPFLERELDLSLLDRELLIGLLE